MDEVSPFEPTVVTAVARHWRLVVIVILVCTIPAALYAFTRPASYRATASLTVTDPRGPGVLSGQATEPPDRYVADQLPVFGSLTLGERASELAAKQQPPLKHTAGWFLSHTSAAANAQDNNLLTVAFSAPTAPDAMAGLRAVVTAYSDVTKVAMRSQADEVVDQIKSGIRSLDQRLAGLQRKVATDPNAAARIIQLQANRATYVERLDQVAGEAAVPGSGVVQALLPNDASSAGKSEAIRIIVLAFVVGLLAGIGLAYLRSYRKRVFLHERDPELLLHAPLLINASNLHAIDLLGISSTSDGPYAGQKAQDLFGIAASLLVDERFAKDQRGLSFSVITALNGASCTAVSWRIGLALASQGLRVLLIDVEAAWPPAGAWMGQLTDRLPWDHREDGTVVIGTPRPPTRRAGPSFGRTPTKEITPYTGPWKSGLYLCSEAPPVSSQKELRAVFRDLEEDFDVVLVNAPPFLPSADAAHLASAAGSAVVVVPDGASVNDYEELVRRLHLAAANPIGYVYCCSDCDVPSPEAGNGERLKRVLHVEGTRAPLRKVSGLKPTS
jgi:Mrp family chromosome partitioning ATPase/capsular polysaccharide biosynthesis protein